jgi:hypothetical protein
MQNGDKNRDGFGHLVLFILFIIVAVVVFSAWKIVANKDTDSSTNKTDSSTSEEAEDKKSSLKITVLESGNKILPDGYAYPSVIKTGNGYRMYINRQSGGQGGYLTYTSTDGDTWEKELDVIFPGVATGRAVPIETGVRFFYPGAQPIKPSDPPASIQSSSSADGTTFTKDSGNRVEPRDSYYLEGPTVFQLADKSWRMYFNENTIASGNQRDGEIWGASSTDGLTWTRDESATIVYDQTEKDALGTQGAWSQVLHPFVLANPKGGYIMLYNAHSEVFAASSSDGKTWEKLGKIGLHGADVDGYFESDDTIHLFYGDYSEKTGGLVYDARLKVE